MSTDMTLDQSHMQEELDTKAALSHDNLERRSRSVSKDKGSVKGISEVSAAEPANSEP